MRFLRLEGYGISDERRDRTAHSARVEGRRAGDERDDLPDLRTHAIDKRGALARAAVFLVGGRGEIVQRNAKDGSDGRHGAEGAVLFSGLDLGEIGRAHARRAGKLYRLHPAIFAPDTDRILSVGDAMGDNGGNGRRTFRSKRERSARRTQILDIVGGTAELIIFGGGHENEKRLAIRTENLLMIAFRPAHAALHPVRASTEAASASRAKTTRRPGPTSALNMPGAISRVAAERGARPTRRRVSGSSFRKTS